MGRKNPLVTGQVYHVFSRSIADFKIFNKDSEYQRMIHLLYFFQIQQPPEKFSRFLNSALAQKIGFRTLLDLATKDQAKTVDIIAYCLMPTHIHLILKQLVENGISKFMANILNSYTRYFNLVHDRKGPLWESKFKNVLVGKDEELAHLMRYIHLNPVTASLVKKPEDWQYSSYMEYIDKDMSKICSLSDLISISPIDYQKFVEDRIDYQRQLAMIKKLVLD